MARRIARGLNGTADLGLGPPRLLTTGERGLPRPLPRGDVFCPLLADPKGQRSFVSYLRETGDGGDMDIGSVGISDAFGLVRIGGSNAGDGFQISLAGSVFAQFDLNTSSYDLINADYIVLKAFTPAWVGGPHSTVMWNGIEYDQVGIVKRFGRGRRSRHEEIKLKARGTEVR